MAKALIICALGAISAFVLFYVLVFWLLRNPIFVVYPSGDVVTSDVTRLKTDVRFLTSITPSRSRQNVVSLNRAAGYIREQFTQTGCKVEEQRFAIGGEEYTNIICSFGPRSSPRIVIGAHYDVFGDNNPGADDNASGVAAVLEIARMISAQTPNLKHRLDLVAFTLEETPRAQTADMGSYVHVKSLADGQTQVRLMVSVEMIGFYFDEAGSQNYPLSLLKWFYPDKGNFIGIVGLLFDRSIVSRAKRLMSVKETLPVYSINAPGFIPGIDLSDHRNYWDFGYPAVMVTDTAFHRNPNYHRPSDTADSLDYERLPVVVDGLYRLAVNF